VSATKKISEFAMSSVLKKIPRSLAVSAMLLAVAILPVSPAVAAEQQYKMGVFPHLPARELEKVFSPMAASLARGSDSKIQFRSSSTYRKFMEQLDKEVWDIAFLQPFDYVRAHDEHGYIPLATRQEMLASIVVVLPDSNIKSAADLKGKKIALPPAVAAVSLLTRAALQDAGLDPDKDVTITHHKSHVSCMQQVVLKNVDACGTAAPAVRFFKSKHKKELRTVMDSKKIPHTLFAVHPRVPEKIRKKLRDTILGWGKEEATMELLKRGRLKPFRPIADSDYDIVRKFGSNKDK
jgi:phosphonate transport system substrate-binding protein